MKLQKRQDGWYVIEVPDTVTECGPYATKADADEDMRGLERFFKYSHLPNYVTTFRKEKI